MSAKTKRVVEGTVSLLVIAALVVIYFVGSSPAATTKEVNAVKEPEPTGTIRRDEFDALGTLVNAWEKEGE